MEQILLSTANLSRIFLLTVLSFLLAMAWTPLLTNIIYKFNLRKKIRNGETPVFSELHKEKVNTPTMGGVLVWVTVLVITLLFNLTRSQTWLPTFALVTTGILGAIDDLLNINGIGPNGGGLRARHKLVWLLLIAILGAWWFYYKLEWNIIHIPGWGDLAIGAWYVPLFIFVIVASANAVNITDGLDGLAAGLLAMAFLAFGGIAFIEGNYGLAGFCGTVSGAMLAFLWFNIYPARFFMGDTGSLALGATLGVIAMLTNSVLVLPVIGFVFVVETLSVILQLIYKACYKKKLFLSSPLHHHLQALGWPEAKVTMRFWVIGAVMAVIGFVIAMIGRG